MEIKIIEDSVDTLKIELVGEDSTLVNLLKEELYKDEKVLSAAYYVKHPLTSSPQLIIKTSKGRKAKIALKSALARVDKESKEFVEKVKKAV